MTTDGLGKAMKERDVSTFCCATLLCTLVVIVWFGEFEIDLFGKRS